MVKNIVSILFLFFVALLFPSCSFLLSSPFSPMVSWADNEVKISDLVSDIASPPYEGVDMRLRCVGVVDNTDTKYVIFAVFVWSSDGNKLRLIVMDDDLSVEAVFNEDDFFSTPGHRFDNIFWDGSYLWWGSYKIDVGNKNVTDEGGTLTEWTNGLYVNGNYYLLKNETSGTNGLSYSSVASSFPPSTIPTPSTLDYFSSATSVVDNWISTWETEKYFSILMSMDSDFIFLSVPYDISSITGPLMDFYPHASFSGDAGYDLWGDGTIAVGGDTILVLKEEDDKNYIERYNLSGSKKSTDEWPFYDDSAFALSRDGSVLYVFDRKSGYIYKGAVWW
ncbi:hypothetical protein WKV44_01455 [Spirochaetia bacterium 38H-sp]|uniref:Uncharacterized protein n=1 Tax=Rarispira pelagica TaxID=3141764 RepID=A0ABU9U967_9SPIR